MKQLDDNFNFGVAIKTLPTEGNLVYEYNPFFNYRLDHTMIYYKNKLLEILEFCDLVGITREEFDRRIDSGASWSDLVPASESTPIVYLRGQLCDFETNELSFSLKNPIIMTPLWSYDNSVNLVINDGLNPPRLINSRFSTVGRNKYLVCNRKGNNDSNIYDLGEQFDIDTSLYKKIVTIPKLRFIGTIYGGSLSVGNYHFYFKYVDEDGNESDFFAESGLVSLFIGNTADSIREGFRDENSYKQVRFLLSNVDSGYSKVVVYYTRSTGEIFLNATVSAYRIDQEYRLNENGNTIIAISGFEPTSEVSLDVINMLYLIYGSVKALAAAQNMLFLANVDRPKIPYEDLADCALRFIPIIDNSEKYDINLIGIEYLGPILNTYWDVNYIYNKVGYWDDEMYRLGIVFIQADNTLTLVFNVRGGVIDINSTVSNFTDIPMFENGTRVYINYDELYYGIIDSSGTSYNVSTVSLENAKGVIKINCPEFNTVIGIRFYVKHEVIEYLINTLKIRGFFFVRQKRIPTTLCLAYTIGIDKQSYTPVLPLLNENDVDYVTESFITQNERLLDHNFTERMYTLEPLLVRVLGAICPDYDVNSIYLNSLFSSSELVVRNCNTTNYLLHDITHFYPTSLSFDKAEGYSTVKIVGVEDNTKLAAIGDYLFSARAGEAEEGFRFEYIGKENIHTDATNILRGSYGPFLGITGYENPGHLIDIKIPGFSPALINEYFLIRYNDKSAYYAISDRYDLSNTSQWLDLNGEWNYLSQSVYRGDCYICLFTHRINRNFLDPSAPANDLIVDPKCWRDHFEVADGVVKTENFLDINLGDINAVLLGMYITFTVRSTINLNIRAIDESIPDEVALFGRARGFFPYYPMTTRGAYKIPEALCYNKGYEKSLSERYNFEVPDVPWIKNEFSNRIAYSNILVLDAFLNGWRTYLGSHYRDYPKTYGSITTLMELFGNLLCVFEHGIALIPVNERAVAGEGAGGNVYINTSNVLPENPKMLSDMYGTLWAESVIKTPYYVYGVDTVGKKIWRTNGSQFEIISDFKIQEFLNNNISLTERELDPVIGVRNVKSHYNAFKLDVMFTFYDNLHGFEEKVWSICYNELLQKWVTFYSWIPSYSANIDNILFSFDRNTSKWISKLGVSHFGNDFADGVTLENNIITEDGLSTLLHLSNRNLPNGDGVEYSISYELERDNFGNYKLFKIENGNLIFTGNYNDVTSEFYLRNLDGSIAKDSRGRRIWLDRELLKNPDKVVLLLNIKANILVSYSGTNPTLGEAYATGFTNKTFADAGYYESVVAVIPQYNMLFLTTDFWKHGQGGIIDIADKIYPTYWYGKLHPFEFEVVVVDNPAVHKIFNNISLVSNKAVPESFHYEIIGECFDFAKDKPNMFVRQEITKDLYLYNGSDILYNNKLFEVETNQNKKSISLPLYYTRLDTFNEVEDYYKQATSPNKDYSNLSGTEVVYYPNLNEFRLWEHSKAVDIEVPDGRIRGNMNYQEDLWNIQINPIIFVEKNELPWNNKDEFGTTVKPKVPITVGNSPVPNDLINTSITLDDIPKDLRENLGYTLLDIDNSNWNIYPVYSSNGEIVYSSGNSRKEVKVKDKFIKIRIRYSGKDLAIIAALRTMYSVSYA